MMEEKDLDTIEQYLEGGMTAHQAKEFESQLKADTALRHKYQEAYALIHGIKSYERQEQFRKLLQVDMEMGEVPKQRHIRWAYMAAAASIAIIAGALVFVPGMFRSSDDIFQAYYKPYPVLENSVKRGRFKELSLKEQAYVYYENEQYEDALNSFIQLSQNEELNDIDNFYMGLSCLSLGSTTEAIQILEKLKKDNNVYLQQTYWYLSLAYVKNGEEQKATELLTSDGLQRGSYKQRADKLLGEIN